ncbi:FAD-dependent oxidoreductase, partial [Brasilonema sp. CT11]|nr:FAD-dependent oxidoreductase [Brasilonema sp. CT11]
MQFDYIVLGGGTAGCFIAQQLSQKGASVALIEQGGVPSTLNYNADAMIKTY